ncbi:condensation domain-containing protein [Saccharopolyspora sp. NFXS83]|uniref:condensation domain-containing protein n=1 Tax=Saccharopolyspora sp. NFXS83 TaxID=2993560 RepID=UPI00224A9DCE|nr:condensation domain-containing protein [Saccharopolyspora sp. NFXS83]MCX2732757.1 condensation domain-containing protein [Saccharopolyspora sp. NFXS83]
MRVTTISAFDPPPGDVVEWTAEPAPGHEFAPSDVPPSLNQSFHLSALGDDGTPPPWLACTFELPGELDTDALEAAFGQWVRRHAGLLSRFTEQDGEFRRALLPADGVVLRRRESGAFTGSAAVREHLSRRFDEQCHPLRWPPFLLGAVRHEGGSTVFGAFDHSCVDAHSMAVAAHELQVLYFAAAAGTPPSLAEVGGFVDYCAQEHEAVAAEDLAAPGRPDTAEWDAPGPDGLPVPPPLPSGEHPAVTYWRDFLRDCGGTTPSFPLELGVEPGRPVRQRSMTARLLDAETADAFDVTCRDGSGSAFTGVLAAAGLALRELGAGDRISLLIPLHTRHEPRWRHAVGWFTTNAPVTFNVVDGRFADTHTHAKVGFREALGTLGVPLPNILAAVADEYRPVRKDIFMMSYVDYRAMPVSLEFPESRPRHISSETDADDVQLWVSRTSDGLFLRTRHPGVAAAESAVRAFHDRFSTALTAASEPRALATHR